MAKDPVCGMDVDVSRSLKLTKNNEVYYFCSKHCLEKFLGSRNIAGSQLKGCIVESQSKWYHNRLFIASLVLFFIYSLSFILPILAPFRENLIMYFKKMWWAVSLGLILGGVIDHFIPREYVSHILSKPRKRTILYSVILGFFMSACSHGILALSIELHKKGASNPAVVAFLLASPWANLPLTIMLLAFFGLKALYIIVAAVIIAITTGFIYQVLESKNLIEINKNILETKKDFSIAKDIRSRFFSHKFSMEDIKGIYRGSVSLANMVLWWIIIGMVFASLASSYVPRSVFQNYMGPSIFGMLVTLTVATILEVCSEGTAPLAFEIYRQTLAFGNAFVFLMAGVVTDYTEIGLLYFNVGKRVAILLPIITVPQVIIFGIIANKLF
ncbi:MAG: permease [Candidatus Omnitrophota bacterium]